MKSDITSTKLAIPAERSDILIRDRNTRSASVIERLPRKILKESRKQKWNIVLAESESDTTDAGNSGIVLPEGESPLDPLRPYSPY